jgi:hypothetical protein
MAFSSNRADLVQSGSARADIPEPENGGRVLLNASAFAIPDARAVGNTGRNAFRAPGFYNLDFSMSRTFVVPALRERLKAVLRADVFNLLNHANLGAPNNILIDLIDPAFGPGDEPFGLARYGRSGVSTGFPAAIPFQETARRIQLMLRVEF